MQRPRGIVIPSRDDSVLAKSTELIGGPLGERTSPGLIRTGFFSVERVLVLLVLASAVLALIFKDHCRQLGWLTPDQYSTVCYSQFPNVFTEHDLARLFPYFSPGATFNYPPLTGLIAGITAWLSGFAGLGAAQLLAFFDLSAAFLVIGWLLGTLALARSNRLRPWDAAIFAASPLLLFTAFSSWDLWAAALSAVGLFLFSRRRVAWAGVLLGLASCVQPYAALILLALILAAARRRAVPQAAFSFGAALLAWLVINLPPLMLNPASWVRYWGDGWSGDAATGSMYQIITELGARLGGVGFSPTDASWTSLILTVVGVAAVSCLNFRAAKPPRAATLAFLLVAWFLLVDKYSAPEHLVWLLPLLALARPRWRAALVWQLFGLLWYLAQLFYLGVILGDNNTQHGIDVPYFVLAAFGSAVATLILAALMVREILKPQFDLVRRRGVDDPLFHWLPAADSRPAAGPHPGHLATDSVNQRPEDISSY